MFKSGDIVTCVDIEGTIYNGIKGPNLKTITKGKKYKVLDNYNRKIVIADNKGTYREYLSSRFKKIVEPSYRPRKIIRDVWNW